MAKFLNTTGISYNLERLIRESRERLILISPYLRINPRLRQLIEDKDRDKIDIRVIYGKNELQPEENNWLKSQQFVRSSICQNLHAKCYLNENEALITSMNLYEFSQVNNEEMGVLVARSDDAALYSEIYDDAVRLIRVSQEIRVSVERIPPTESNTRVKGKSVPATGLCIRCRSEIKTDPLKPYCLDCYRAWKQLENPEFEERHCHTCGKPNKSTLLKPTCWECYRAYKDVLTFALGKT